MEGNAKARYISQNYSTKVMEQLEAAALMALQPKWYTENKEQQHVSGFLLWVKPKGTSLPGLDDYYTSGNHQVYYVPNDEKWMIY